MAQLLSWSPLFLNELVDLTQCTMALHIPNSLRLGRCLREVCMNQGKTTAIPQRKRKLEGVNLRMNGEVPSPTEAVLIPWTALAPELRLSPQL
uniref:Macaca fascicularis brain cDNA clone: QflA-20350, similar to human protein phosphatase 1, regulatory (inhibitor) subunit 9A(PPP1R9A), mRNA, RefSeq: XM_371933.1 n=1 Tax=Macaca fascicularis TaxID=9541 RepID=I7GCU2_MACFA|nr:unnamed protein product [Macaca fascicularis]